MSVFSMRHIFDVAISRVEYISEVTKALKVKMLKEVVLRIPIRSPSSPADKHSPLVASQSRHFLAQPRLEVESRIQYFDMNR